MSAKSKINLNWAEIPTLPPEERRYSFEEVATGLTARARQLKRPPDACNARSPLASRAAPSE